MSAEPVTTAQAAHAASLAVMPFFRKTLLLPEHVQINSGAAEEAGAIYPKLDWRRVSEAEFANITGQGFKPKSEAQNALHFGGVIDGPLVSLLELPGHIRERWWYMAEWILESSPRQSDSPAARAFFDAVLEFLSFKRAPLSGLCNVQIIINSPGLRATGNFGQLTGSPSASAVATRATPLFYAFNLGDEPVAIWFSSLTKSEDRALLANSPFIRLRLSPGEAVAAWPQCMFIGGDTLEKRDPDLILKIATRPAPDATRGVA